LTTLSAAESAYRLCAQAEGRSLRAIQWIMSSMRYFGESLGEKQDIREITADDLRRFIIALQRTPKFRHHPFNRPQEAKLSPQSIETYARRAIRAFFGYLYREELLSKNPMQRVKMPKVPMKVVQKR
jgi:site-specific recombinase XerD